MAGDPHDAYRDGSSFCSALRLGNPYNYVLTKHNKKPNCKAGSSV